MYQLNNVNKLLFILYNGPFNFVKAIIYCTFSDVEINAVLTFNTQELYEY